MHHRTCRSGYRRVQKNPAGHIKSPCFLTLNGDSICPVDLGSLLKFHRQKNALVTVILSRAEKTGDYGQVLINEDGLITSFQEKKAGKASGGLVNAGVYLMEKTILDFLPSGCPYSLERDVFPLLARKRIYGYVADKPHVDIGTPERYTGAQAIFKNNGRINGSSSCFKSYSEGDAGLKKEKAKIPFGTVTVTGKARELILEALDRKRISSGRLVREFEKKFAELYGVRDAVAVSSGTDADALALAVLYDYGAGRGDEVIVPALSFVATGNAVLQAGFTPVFIDINPFTLNINPDLIEKAVTGRTRAVMPVHLMGKPADMDRINETAARYGLCVIEDAAEAFGAFYKGKKIGTLGDMAAFSLYVAHVITTGEGGVVITNDEDKAAILRSLRAHGRACKCKTCISNLTSGYCAKRFDNPSKTDIRFVFERHGFSAKMNELEAAIGLGSLECYGEIVRKRRKNLGAMIEMIQNYSEFMYTIQEEEHEKIGPHAFPVILKQTAPFSRDALVDYLEKNGVDSRNLFQSMPTQCAGFNFLGYKYGDFPAAEYVANHGLHIGVHQDINDHQIEYLDKVIKSFIQRSV